jgi:hypothetical protein
VANGAGGGGRGATPAPWKPLRPSPLSRATGPGAPPPGPPQQPVAAHTPPAPAPTPAPPPLRATGSWAARVRITGGASVPAPGLAGAAPRAPAPAAPQPALSQGASSVDAMSAAAAKAMPRLAAMLDGPGGAATRAARTAALEQAPEEVMAAVAGQRATEVEALLEAFAPAPPAPAAPLDAASGSGGGGGGGGNGGGGEPAAAEELSPELLACLANPDDPGVLQVLTVSGRNAAARGPRKVQGGWGRGRGC